MDQFKQNQKTMTLTAANNEIFELKDEIRLLRTMINYLDGNEYTAIRIEIHLPNDGHLIHMAENNANVVGFLKAELVDVSNLLVKAEHEQKEREERMSQQVSSAGTDYKYTKTYEFEGKENRIAGTMIKMPIRSVTPTSDNSHKAEINFGSPQKLTQHTIVFSNGLVGRVTHTNEIAYGIYDVYFTPHNSEELDKIITLQPGMSAVLYENQSII